MAEPTKMGWQVGARFYEHHGADALRHGDFALIREVTGMTLDQFDRGDDPIATEVGWLAVAVWQGNPDLRREQVVRMIEQMKPDEAVRVGWDTPAEAEGDPPAELGEHRRSGSSSRTSDAPPEAQSTAGQEQSSAA